MEDNDKTLEQQLEALKQENEKLKKEAEQANEKYQKLENDNVELNDQFELLTLAYLDIGNNEKEDDKKDTDNKEDK